MKTNTVLVLSATSILLTGSAAFAVNSQPLNGSPAGTSAPANSAITVQGETTAGSASPTPTPSPAAAAEDASTGSSSQPAALGSAEPNRGPSTSAVPSPAEDRTGARLVAPEPVPSRSIKPNDDHGGHGEQEPGDDSHSGNDD